MRNVVFRSPRGCRVELEEVLVAENAVERARGLLGRRPLLPGQGLYLMPCRSVHSFGMAYAIDLVYIDASARICKVVHGLQRWRISASLRAVRWSCWRARRNGSVWSLDKRSFGMKLSALVLLLFLLSGCVSNPARENGGSDDLLQLRQQAAATYQVHDYQKALPLYERLVEAIPGDALLWFRLGNLRARRHSLIRR